VVVQLFLVRIIAMNVLGIDVVWAFNEGRGAARECDRYLMGQLICRRASLN